MSLKKWVISFCAFILFISPAYGYDNLGNSVVATGMGGAYVATANDPSGIFYNPAGLAQINQYMFYGMYNRQTTFGYLLAEKPYSLAGAGVLPFSQGVLGLGISQKGSWAKETQVVTHNTVALSFARFVSSQVSLGANAKFLFNTNYGDKTGADFDLGLMYFATPRLTFGLAGENLAGTDVPPDNLGTFFFYNRRQVKAGLAYELISGEYRTRFGFDAIFKQKKEFATESNNLNNLGIQQSIPIGPTNTVSFRAGYSLGKDYNQDFNSLAFGLSYEFRSGQNIYRFDYSYQDYPYQTNEKLAGDNRFAFTVAFGAPRNHNGYASHKEEPNLAAVSKAALEQEQAEENIWQKPAEIKRDSRLADEIDKSEDKSISRVMEQEDLSTNLPAIKPETPKSQAHASLAGFKVSSQVETVKSRSGKSKSYMFSFKYDLGEKESQVAGWKILITDRPLTSYVSGESDTGAIQVIEGRGIPPSIIVWEGTDKKGMRVSPGKFHYSVMIQTLDGAKHLSNWSSLTIE